MIVTLWETRTYLRVDHDEDDELIGRLVIAAQNHVERLLGYPIEDTYGGVGQDEIPPALG